MAAASAGRMPAQPSVPPVGVVPLQFGARFLPTAACDADRGLAAAPNIGGVSIAIRVWPNMHLLLT